MTAPGVYDVWMHSLASDLGRQLQSEITCCSVLRSQSQKTCIFMHNSNTNVIHSVLFLVSQRCRSERVDEIVCFSYTTVIISAPSVQTELLNSLFPQCLTFCTKLQSESSGVEWRISARLQPEKLRLCWLLFTNTSRVTGSADCGWEAFRDNTATVFYSTSQCCCLSWRDADWLPVSGS